MTISMQCADLRTTSSATAKSSQLHRVNSQTSSAGPCPWRPSPAPGVAAGVETAAARVVAEGPSGVRATAASGMLPGAVAVAGCWGGGTSRRGVLGGRSHGVCAAAEAASEVGEQAWDEVETPVSTQSEGDASMKLESAATGTGSCKRIAHMLGVRAPA